MKNACILLLALGLVVGCSSSDDSGGAAAAAGSAGASSGGSGGASAGSGGASGGSAGASGGSGGAAGGSGGASGGSGGAGGGLMACDPIMDPPGLPVVQGTFVQMADAPPIATTGGDPTGTWYIEKSTTVLPKIAMGQVDVSKSSNVGSGFFAFGADKSFTSHTKFHVTLEIGVLGTQEQDTETSVKGTFTTTGDRLDVTPTCNSGGQQVKPPQFSVNGDKLLMVLFAKTGQGDITLFLEAKRAP